MQSEDLPAEIFIDKGNLLINNTPPYIGFNIDGFPSTTNGINS
jgi:hypothetical protein